MDAFAQDACCVERGLESPRLVTCDAAIRANQKHVSPIWLTQRRDCENVLRRQSLFRVELGNNWSNNRIEQDSQETVAARATPELVCFVWLDGEEITYVDVRDDEIAVRTGRAEKDAGPGAKPQRAVGRSRYRSDGAIFYRGECRFFADRFSVGGEHAVTIRSDQESIVTVGE